MLETHNKRDKKHLINLIGRRSGKIPNFAFLIGAGTSASSGIKTSSQMIAEWRQQVYNQSNSDNPFEEWLLQQDWYEDDEEYSLLFEKVYDQPSQRRIYIEECVKDVKPSWGHIYLANIVENNYVNAIFTPNFDDLLNETCFLYADLKTLVCAHDSAVTDVRITSARPKIIKLHGDFLYDSIKNTVKETETLEKNMRDKFMQFAREYGLVVIGYGGNDRSIMEILDTMLKSEGFFPNGLYWCILNDIKVSKKLNRLLRRENAYWIEIEGFDEFMAELHEGLGLKLPPSVGDPYKATTERLNEFILPIKEIKHPVIQKDVKELEEKVKIFEQIISGKGSGKEFNRLIPYHFLGDTWYNEFNYENALIYFEKALVQNPDNLEILENMTLSYIWTEQFEKALEISEKLINSTPNNYEGYYLKGISLVYFNKIEDSIANFDLAIKFANKNSEVLNVLRERSNSHLIDNNWGEALSDCEKALQISKKNPVVVVNKCLALKKLNKEDDAKKILNDILPEIDYNYRRACAFALLNDKENMLRELETAIKEDVACKIDAKYDQEFAEYKNDPDFRKLIYGENNIE